MSAELFPGVLANVLLMLGLLLFFTSAIKNHPLVKLLVAVLFIFVNFRYLGWRLETTIPAFSFEFTSVWMWMFFLAEASSALLLSWYFLVLAYPKDRRMDADYFAEKLAAQQVQPGVDIFIPTINEPRAILQRTLTAACQIDYPDFTVWVLDDGNRDWLKQYCAEKGVRYLSRQSRKGFKAGNLNHALKQTHQPVICVVDADFELQKNFLNRTVGFFSDSSIGLVQTPQFFKNPDAVQYNLYGEKAWPEAQCMFSDVMQSGRDRWDNAFCYGTSFIVRRSSLEEINGFPEVSITEDFHLSYVLLSKGYKTRFLNERLSTGLATQDIAEFVVQRSRWCVGTLQCLFIEGGWLRSKGLSILDRLFFLDPILYHLSSLWTFFLLLSPVVFWWFGVPPFFSDFGHLLIVFAPRMMIVLLGFYWLSEQKTIPVVSELGRVVGIFYLVSSIFKVFLNPFKQNFRITIKSQKLDRAIIYWPILWPLLTLMGAIIMGIALRYFEVLSIDIIWRSDMSLMISLTIYVLWLLFLSALTCVQRPMPEGTLDTVEAVHVGSVRKTIRVLFKRALK